MTSDTHDAEETQVTQASQDGNKQAQKEVQVESVDWQAAIKERDGRIAELEAQVAEAAKSAETADALRNEIAELKAQGESDRIEFELRLAGVRNVKAARAVLADHGGNVAALKEAEPWLFSDAPTGNQKAGTTGLPNAGTSADNKKTMARWRRWSARRRTVRRITHSKRHRFRRELYGHPGCRLPAKLGLALSEQRQPHHPGKQACQGDQDSQGERDRSWRLRAQPGLQDWGHHDDLRDQGPELRLRHPPDGRRDGYRGGRVGTAL